VEPVSSDDFLRGVILKHNASQAERDQAGGQVAEKSKVKTCRETTEKRVKSTGMKPLERSYS
jgi:hypothetical protein